MTMTTITRRTELAPRRSDGIDVCPFWNEPTSRVTVGVLDARTDDGFELSGSTDATRSTRSTIIAASATTSTQGALPGPSANHGARPRASRAIGLFVWSAGASVAPRS